MHVSSLSRRRWLAGTTLLAVAALFSLLPVFTDAQEAPPSRAARALATLRASVEALDAAADARGGLPGPQAQRFVRVQSALDAAAEALAQGDRPTARRAGRRASEELHALWLWLDTERVDATLAPAQQRQLLQRAVTRIRRRIGRVKAACTDAGIACVDDEARDAYRAFQAALQDGDLGALRQAYVALTTQVRRVEATLVDHLEGEDGQ